MSCNCNTERNVNLSINSYDLIQAISNKTFSLDRSEYNLVERMVDLKENELELKKKETELKMELYKTITNGINTLIEIAKNRFL